MSARYLQNFGVTLLRGRPFSDADNETTPPVAIVNEAFVKRFFKPGEDPLDQHFGLDMPELANTFRIVGEMRRGRIDVLPADPGSCGFCDARDICRVESAAAVVQLEGA